MDDDVLPELRRHRIQQFTGVDRLVPRLDLAALDPLFLLNTQLSELCTQNVEIPTELARQCRKPALMLGARQLDDGRECPLLLAVPALFLLPGLTLFAFAPALLLAFFAFFFALLFALAFTSLLLRTLQLTAVLARLLFGLLDDGFDHHLELGGFNAVLLGGVVEIEHPLDRGQPGQPLDLDLEAASAFFIAAGELHDGRLAGVVASAYAGHSRTKPISARRSTSRFSRDRCWNAARCPAERALVRL